MQKAFVIFFIFSANLASANPPPSQGQLPDSPATAPETSFNTGLSSSHLQTSASQLSTSNLCTICAGNSRHIKLNCGHQSYCLECLQNIRPVVSTGHSSTPSIFVPCPACRAPITSYKNCHIDEIENRALSYYAGLSDSQTTIIPFTSPLLDQMRLEHQTHQQHLQTFFARRAPHRQNLRYSPYPAHRLSDLNSAPVNGAVDDRAEADPDLSSIQRELNFDEALPPGQPSLLQLPNSLVPEHMTRELSEQISSSVTDFFSHSHEEENQLVLGDLPQPFFFVQQPGGLTSYRRHYDTIMNGSGHTPAQAFPVIRSYLTHTASQVTRNLSQTLPPYRGSAGYWRISRHYVQTYPNQVRDGSQPYTLQRRRLGEGQTLFIGQNPFCEIQYTRNTTSSDQLCSRIHLIVFKLPAPSHSLLIIDLASYAGTRMISVNGSAAPPTTQNASRGIFILTPNNRAQLAVGPLTPAVGVSDLDGFSVEWLEEQAAPVSLAPIIESPSSGASTQIIEDLN